MSLEQLKKDGWFDNKKATWIDLIGFIIAITIIGYMFYVAASWILRV